MDVGPDLATATSRDAVDLGAELRQSMALFAALLTVIAAVALLAG